MDQHAIRAAGAFSPPPSAQPSYRVSAVKDRLQSIDDFDKENPFTPKPKLIQIKPTKIILECAIRVNNLWISHGIIPEFTYNWFAQQCTSVKLQFLDEVLEVNGPFASKKHAKEEVCKLALPRMQALDKQLGRKRKVCEAPETSSSGVSAAVLKSENFVSLLQDYSQSRHLSLPEYSEAHTATTPFRFQCSVRIADGPLTPFGSQTELYPNKNEAKRAAAREAVKWLRSQGRVAAPFKRPRTGNSPPVLLDLGHTGLTQAVNDIDVDAADELTLSQQVHESVALLGFSLPTFDSRPTMPPPGAPIQSGHFVNMAVTFNIKDVALEPRLAGAVVQVEHVYGKKKARELCCRELLRVLEGIKTSRLK
ncbi:hypothetical protein LTR08_002402 [Meristemomyces frigidus]|nr:hypothetical protein LTR08_002402 [Meristemomyces frigidus]